MWGAALGVAGMATLRIAMTLGMAALWLISRPGGWAVLVVLTLVGVKLLPAR